jgi:hypothetical protein
MPSNDITFCNNKDCEIKKDCFRFKSFGDFSASANKHISVAHFVPHYDESGVRCEMFIKKESKQ